MESGGECEEETWAHRALRSLQPQEGEEGLSSRRRSQRGTK